MTKDASTDTGNGGWPNHAQASVSDATGYLEAEAAKKQA